MKNADLEIDLVEITDDVSLITDVKKLLTSYGDYMFTELNLIAGKESFYKDLENFPTIYYQPPLGTFVLSKIKDVGVGCVGIKKFSYDNCEMKRMFIKPEFRGRGIGFVLCNWVIQWCRRASYKKILLDTNIEMKDAIALYQKCGFKEISPYCINENNHPVFMELEL
ncbi:MAG: GNAT family N-acetyltransferase [Bacteroidota bacterium]|nr:GNAT family N-acetyltransferase [Bacteroidota bacterium]